MRKTLGIIFKALLVGLVISWMGLIMVESYRYKKDLPMLVVLNKDVKNYEDGNVTIYYGLGYKKIEYQRTSIYGKEFGHIFIRVRDKVPNKE